MKRTAINPKNLLVAVTAFVVGAVLMADSGEAVAGERKATPAPVQTFIDAWNGGDAERLARTFTDDGILIDVDRKLKGRDAIKGFARSELLNYRVKVLEVGSDKEGNTTMLVRVRRKGATTGGFKARFVFTLKSGLLAKANLQYA